MSQISPLSPVAFHGDTIYCISYQNQPYTAMKPIVENMGLNWPSQSAKLNACKARWGVAIIAIPSTSGEQNTLCMPVRKLPAYLASINPNKVRPELREKIIRYQNECDDVLWNYWTKERAGKSSALPPSDRSELKALVDAKLSMFPDSVQGKARAELWTRFNRRFRIAEYAQLPAGKMADARDYIITLELRAVKGIETKAAPAPALVPAKKPAKPAPMTKELKELAAMQGKLDLLIQTVQLHGLTGYSSGDEKLMRDLVKARNAHIRTASNCLIMAKLAISAALA